MRFELVTVDDQAPGELASLLCLLADRIATVDNMNTPFAVNITNKPGEKMLRFWRVENAVETAVPLPSTSIPSPTMSWSAPEELEQMPGLFKLGYRQAQMDAALFMGLTFAQLRAANEEREPLYKNAKGEPEDCADWTLSDWSNATLGELGEAANIVKKIRRGDMTLDEARRKLALELADVIVYLDLYAAKAQIDLGRAVKMKFNEVSERIGVDVKL